MENFAAGRAVASFIGIVGWLTVALAALLFLSLLNRNLGWIELSVTVLPIAGLGFVVVLVGQMAYAQFSAAEGIWRLVALNEQAARVAKEAAAKAAAVRVEAKATPTLPENTEHYRGIEILKVKGFFRVFGVDHVDMASAQATVDKRLADN